MATKILVIPDIQANPDHNDFDYLTSVGNYIVAKKPEIVVNLGDMADMSSLSSHDKPGSKTMEGKRYKADIAAVTKAMNALLTPLWDYNAKAKKNKEKQYKPRMVMITGNHENRITRAVEADPKLEGLISLDDLPYEDWEIIPFLDVIVIEGIAFSHYFCGGAMGKPIGSAQALLTKKHMSCVAGHQQGRQVAFGRRADGKEMTALIIGSCYMHDEAYMSSQSNQYWRGLYILHNVNDGSFDECAVPLHYIIENY